MFSIFCDLFFPCFVYDYENPRRDGFICFSLKNKLENKKINLVVYAVGTICVSIV